MFRPFFPVCVCVGCGKQIQNSVYDINNRNDIFVHFIKIYRSFRKTFYQKKALAFHPGERSEARIFLVAKVVCVCVGRPK